MIKIVILSSFICLSSVGLLFTSQNAMAEEIVTSPESMILNTLEKPSYSKLKALDTDERFSEKILTRYWTSGWTKTGNPAPAVAFFQSGAYRGWLSKYQELPSSFGTTGYYEGYFYHDSLPLPIPSKLALLAD